MLSNYCHTSQEEGGQGLAEYSFIISLVAIVVMIVIAFFGVTLKDQFCRVTYGLTPFADLSSACSRPIVNLVMHDQGPNTLNIEANVFDPDGDPGDPYAAISKVEFYYDDTSGSPVQTEFEYRYCLSGNPSGTPCGNRNISGLSTGKHTVIALVYDDDGNVGRAQYGFTK
jgi:Flp pilus assembly pilin Flp